MAQAGVDNTFYRVKPPDKMDEHFSLPSAHLDALRQLAEAAGISIDLPEARFGSPLLQVLPMGRSWSLCFCQRLLEATVLRAGIDAGPLIKDLHAPPQVRASSTRPGACVDNVCVAGGGGDRCVANCSAVDDRPEKVGLKCRGVMEPEDLQTFTGIIFERRSGRVGVSPARMWKARLALLSVADRRPLLSIFQQTYVFARVAGRRCPRPWGRVELELRQAAALVVFAFSDSKKPTSAFVYASGASWGQSGSAGGCGVVGQAWANELVERTAASAEARRCSVLGAIGAKECALGFGPVEGAKVGRHRARAGSTGFEGVGGAAIGELNDWGVLFHGARVQRDEDIAVPEGRAALMAARHAVRGRSGHGHRHFILVDIFGLALAVGEQRQTLQRGVDALVRRRRCRGDSISEPEPASHGHPGAAGLGDSLLDDPCPLGGLAGLLCGPGASGVDSDSSSTSSSEAFDSDRGEGAAAEGRGLTVLQSLKVGSASRAYFEKGCLDFATRARARGRSTPGASAIDSSFAQGSSRATVARELLFAAVDVALHRGWRSFAIVLALSWDTMVRLPSELVQITRETPVAPAPCSGRAARSLLLFPQESDQVSKTLGCDEGVVLSDAMPHALGPDLAKLRRARQGRQSLWDFNATASDAKVRTVFEQLGHLGCHPHPRGRKRLFSKRKV
ncbi:unnamed protein product [Prorocentrum cordatum]|uniref:Uncharacterized protein n=1 Tax=Prorocentrum cordatum TaxID=2364126 RepID=A0ABN9RXK7_9DINO|nr:unnamed protein product [Polarella glacialis]